MRQQQHRSQLFCATAMPVLVVENRRRFSTKCVLSLRSRAGVSRLSSE